MTNTDEKYYEILNQGGFRCTHETVHSNRFARGCTTIYIVPQKTINIVVAPKNEQLLKNEGIAYKINHNTGFRDFPKRRNRGEKDITYGLKIDFDSIVKLKDFIFEKGTKIF